MTQRRVLVIIDSIESDYQVEAISGVVRATRASDANLAIVTGGWLGTSQHPVARNFVYDLIPDAAVDGMVVMAGSLSHQCGIEHFRAWLGRFRVPVVCMGIDISGFTSVFVDNGIGTYAAVSHLIERHGRRRIACLRGPAGSSEASQRYDAYASALVAHDLAVNPALTCSAPILAREDGLAGIATLFEKRGLTPSEIDGIVCVNDDVALGAMEALTRRGILIPEQISIVGFDDNANAKVANPPLTTVNQRVELQGYTAGRALIEMLDSGLPGPSQRLDSVEVVRASCGCLVPQQNDSRGIETGGGGRSFALAFLDRQMMIKAEMARAAAGRLGNQNGWEEKLLMALAKELQTGDSSFRFALESVARKAISVGGSIDACNDMLTSLRLQVLAVALSKPEIRPRVEDMFQEARLLITTVALSAYRDRDQAVTDHMRNISKACMGALATQDTTALSRALSTHLPPLGVAACSINRLSVASRRGPQLEIVARLSPDFVATKTAPLPMSSLGIDQTLQHRAAVVLMPLEFNQRPVGLAGFAWGAYNPMTYELLREWLSVAVYASGVQNVTTPGPAPLAESEQEVPSS
jgi:sigma-B regulation protein RsbU (phosphoserine phosphatase)